MLFTLEVLPAAEGDCLLLHWGTEAKPKIAVIDGGPGQVYEKTLRPRLEDILSNHGTDHLELDLLMISHMDDDHIIGIMKLVRDVKREIERNTREEDRPFRLRRLWHNVFNDVLGDSIDKYFKTLTASFQASVNDSPNPDVVERLAKAFKNRRRESREVAQEDAWDVAKVLAGHNDGRTVRDDYEFLSTRGLTSHLNSAFKDSQGRPGLITPETAPANLEVNGLEFTIVGPRQAEIEKLQEEFDDYIESKGLTAEAVLAAYADRSVKNLSSIVCLARFGSGNKQKTILLTGDARGDKILAGLEEAGLLPANGTISVDILKVPHHGSDRNVEPEFFRRILAKTYVLSGDGKNGNPDRDTLEWIVKARGESAKFDIVLTYPVSDIDTKRKADFRKKRKAWNTKRDSLATFFEETAAQDFSFSLQPGAPFMINLGGDKVTW